MLTPLEFFKQMRSLMEQNLTWGTWDATYGNYGLCLVVLTVVCGDPRKRLVHLTDEEQENYRYYEGLLETYVIPLRITESWCAYWFNNREERLQALNTVIYNLETKL